MGRPAEIAGTVPAISSHQINAFLDRGIPLTWLFRKSPHAVGEPSHLRVGITDSDTTPIARHCQRYLIAEVASPSFVNSYVAPMALISLIHVACAHLDPKRSLTRLKPTDREYLSGTRWYRERKEA